MKTVKTIMDGHEIDVPEHLMPTATLIRKLDGFTGHAALYRLNPPIKEESWDDTEPPKFHQFVAVSAANIPYVGGTETYIFPADEHGKVTNWGELSGSTKGTLSHADALENAGYRIVDSGVSA